MKTQHQKAFLTTTVVALGAAALMGVFAIFVDLGNTGEKVLATTLFVAMSGVLSLAGATAAAHGSSLGRPGMVLACLALPPALTMVWASGGSLTAGAEDWLIKGAGCLAVASAALAHSGLLSLASLGRFRWILSTTRVVAAALAVFAIAQIIDSFYVEDMLGKIVAAAGVFATFGTLALPILHRMSKMGVVGLVTVAADAAISLTCPRCGSTEEVRPGESSCSSCDLGFSIELRENRCPCGYSLYGLTGENCPECGRLLSA